MKNLILFILCITGGYALQAAVLTVNNIEGSIAQYATFSSAHNAASSGDTLLIHSSTSSYGNVTVSKQLTILGPGLSAVDGGLDAYFGIISLYNGSSGTSIGGIRAQQIKQQCFNVANDISVINCRITGTQGINVDGCDNGQANNWVIEGCILTLGSCGGPCVNINVNTGQDWIIRNNFLQNNPYEGWPSSPIWKANVSTTVVNNVYINKGDDGICYECTGSTFENNIVWFTNSIETTIEGEGCEGCTMNNNLFYSPNYAFEELETGADNIYNVNPDFVDIPGVNPTFSMDNDYHLQPTSPAIEGASDGGQMGIYGADFNFTMELYSHLIPRLYQASPQYIVIPEGGSFELNIGAVRAGL